MNITEVSGQKSVPVIVQPVEPTDFKGITKKQFFFRWGQLKGRADIYKLTFEDSPVILGLIALIDVPSEYRIEIKLIAVSKENSGRLKKYDGIAGCLIAYAANIALRKYYGLACLSLTPKTELRQHYIRKYRMTTAGQQVYAEYEVLKELIKTKRYMSLKKLLKEYTLEEIAEAIMIPAKLTAKQQGQANRDLAAARKKSQAAMTEDVKTELNLLQLRFQLEDYLKEAYDPALNFGHFLERYLKILNKKKKDFAAEIQIHETLLSHLIGNRREPNESIIIRLELHSNKIIPAIYWYKLAEKGKEYHILTDNALREKESPFVTHSLQPAD